MVLSRRDLEASYEYIFEQFCYEYYDTGIEISYASIDTYPQITYKWFEEFIQWWSYLL